MRTELILDSAIVEELSRTVTGPVITAGDARYDAARAVYFSGLKRRPGVIVQAADAADVARVIRIAHASGSELAVRNGGHSVAGHGVIDGGIVLDVRALAGLEINAARRIARAGAAVTAGEYTKAAGAHGFATGFGDAPSVAIGGITLAGGIGFLHRRHGMTIDNLAAARIVTADGEELRVDAESHADLFWAIRGGGGNFGVATELEFRLQPVDRVLGGMLMMPATPERLVSLLDIATHAPDELTLIAMAMPAPPMPMIPSEHHGAIVIMVLLVHAGDPDEGARAIAPIRALGTPLVDAIRPMRYAEIYDQHENAPHPVAAALHSRFIDSLDIAAATELIERLRAGTAPMRVAQFRPLGGALARVPADATAFAHRNRSFLVNVAAMYERTEQASEHEQWVASAAAPFGTSNGAYVGFLGRDGADRIHEAYPPATFERLARVKAQYDPTNLFRGNHNIAV